MPDAAKALCPGGAAPAGELPQHAEHRDGGRSAPHRSRTAAGHPLSGLAQTAGGGAVSSHAGPGQPAVAHEPRSQEPARAEVPAANTGSFKTAWARPRRLLQAWDDALYARNR